MMRVLKGFGDLSSLHLSLTKSSIIFPKKMCFNIRHEIADLMGVRSTSNFGTYLGVYISPNKLKK